LVETAVDSIETAVDTRERENVISRRSVGSMRWWIKEKHIKRLWPASSV
jgi:hypothetical protein